MRPGFPSHRKFRRAAKLAGGDEARVLGCLEFIWSHAYEAGESYLGDAEDVELLARWQGEPGLLFRALLECGGAGNAGLVEEVPERPGHYQVHDLFDHAPAYVQRRYTREQERRARGETLSDVRRRAATARWAAHDEQVNATGVQVHANDTTPAPAPAPAPAPKKKKDHVPDLSIFESWYSTYPRNTARAKAEKAWTRLTATERAECLAASPRFVEIWRAWPREDQTFIPHPATFLNERRWREDLPAARGNGKAKIGVSPLHAIGITAENRAQYAERFGTGGPH